MLAGTDPTTVTDHFTDPDLMTTWWAEEAEIDRAGNSAFAWPQQGWTLRGRFLERARGRRICSTWQG